MKKPRNPATSPKPPAAVLPLRREPTEAMRHEVVRQLNALGFTMMVCATCGVTENDGGDEPVTCGEMLCHACVEEHEAECQPCAEAVAAFVTPWNLARVRRLHSEDADDGAGT